jgi:hypothetical protein
VKFTPFTAPSNPGRGPHHWISSWTVPARNLGSGVVSVFVTPTIQVPGVRTTFARPSAYLGEYASFVTYRWW